MNVFTHTLPLGARRGGHPLSVVMYPMLGVSYVRPAQNCDSNVMPDSKQCMIKGY